jgi:hypothetical protein
LTVLHQFAGTISNGKKVTNEASADFRFWAVRFLSRWSKSRRRPDGVQGQEHGHHRSRSIPCYAGGKLRTQAISI